MEYRIEWHDGFVESVTHGDGTFDGIAQMIGEMLSHENWRVGNGVLVDHSALNAGPLTMQEVRSLAELAGQARKQVGKARVAHVVSRDLEFGLVRMWENFVSALWEADVKCFRSRDDAVAWLTATR